MKKYNKSKLIGSLALCAGVCIGVGVLGANAITANAASDEATLESLKVESVALRVPDTTYGEGLRFKLSISATDYTAEGVSELSSGLLLIPQKLLGESSLTVDLANEDLVKAEDITWVADGNVWVSYVHLYNIPDEYYTTDVAVRAYIDGTEDLYSAKVVTSVADVALYAYENDGELDETEKASLQASYLTYDVVYDVDGQKTTVSGVYGQKLTAPTAPEKANYVFAGWWNSTYETEWDFSANTVGGKTTLYAKWEEATKQLSKAVDIAIKGNTVELNEFAEENVTSVTFEGVAVPFTQVGKKLTFAPTASTLTVGVTGKVAITTNASNYEGEALVVTAVITSAQDFLDMRAATHTVDDYYVLGNTIDFENTGVAANATFKGTFDGRGFEIKNFAIKWVTTSNSGLFGNITAGDSKDKPTTIKNFAMTNVTEGADKSGAIANEIKWYTNVENVFIEANLARGSSAMGSTNYKSLSGIVCSNATSFTTFRNCVVVDKAPSTILRSGGLGSFIGYGVSAQPVFYNCYAVSVAERPLVLAYDESSYQGSGVTLAGGFKDGTLATAFASVDALKTHFAKNAGAVAKLALWSETANGTYWGSVKVF